MRGGRVDKNQKEIVAALKQAGASVLTTHNVGKGFPDLVVGFRGVNHLIEVKSINNSYGRKGFNLNQQKWNSEWKGAAPQIAYCVNDALLIIGAIVKSAIS